MSFLVYIGLKQTFASYLQGHFQNYSFENRLCHAAVTDVAYPLFSDFGQEETEHQAES
jgi:hypothetical protein